MGYSWAGSIDVATITAPSQPPVSGAPSTSTPGRAAAAASAAKVARTTKAATTAAKPSTATSSSTWTAVTRRGGKQSSKHSLKKKDALAKVSEPSSGAIRRERLQKGQCLACGKTGHRKMECPEFVKAKAKAKASSTQTNMNAPSNSSQSLCSKKRPRGASSSGVTPPAKKGNLSMQVAPAKASAAAGSASAGAAVQPKRAFSYAHAAKGSLTLHVVRVDGKQLSKEEFGSLVDALNGELADHIAAGGWVPDFEETRQDARGTSVSVPDQRTHELVREVLGRLGFRAQTPEEREELERPKLVLTGFVRGNTGHLSKEVLQLFVDRKAWEMGVQGRVEVLSSIKTEKGGILRVKVTDRDLEKLKAMDLVIPIGAAGRVQFHPVVDPATRVDRRDDKLQRRLEELTSAQQKLDEERKALLEQQATLEETRSDVGSVGMSALTVEADLTNKDSVDAEDTLVGDADDTYRSREMPEDGQHSPAQLKTVEPMAVDGGVAGSSQGASETTASSGATGS
jgi:hypothetical protein